MDGGRPHPSSVQRYELVTVTDDSAGSIGTDLPQNCGDPHTDPDLIDVDVHQRCGDLDTVIGLHHHDRIGFQLVRETGSVVDDGVRIYGTVTTDVVATTKMSPITVITVVEVVGVIPSKHTSSG